MNEDDLVISENAYVRRLVPFLHAICRRSLPTEWVRSCRQCRGGAGVAIIKFNAGDKVHIFYLIMSSHS